MTPTTRGCLVAATVAALLTGTQLLPVTAAAQPEPPPAEPSVLPAEPESPLAAEPDSPLENTGELRNIVYKARIDGVSRGARISYKLDDTQVNTADPTMLPGRTFEATAVLSDPQQAGMTISVDWPYSANLHCEILVENETIARADQFIAPRLSRESDDPLYGTLQCGAPLGGGAGPGNVVNTDPVGLPEPAGPADPAAPMDPADAPPADAPPAD